MNNMKKFLMILILAIFLLGSITYFFFAYNIEYNRNPLIKESIDKNDLSGLYKYYVSGTPLIDGRPYTGNQSPITMISVIDFNSEESKLQHNTIINEIIKNFVNTNQAKIYYKYYVTEADAKQNSERYQKVKAAYCYNYIKGQQSYEYNEALYSANISELASLSEKYGTNKEIMQNCLDKKEFIELKEDTAESELYRIESPSIHTGINGEENTILYGIPSATLINRTIRQKQISLGI